MSDDPLHNLHLTSSGHTADGGFRLSVAADETRNDGVALVFAGMADILEHEDAPNYVEFDLHRGVGKRPVSVCVRWLDRPTPHQLRRTAESHSMQLRTVNQHLNAVIDRVRALHTSMTDADGYLRCRTCRQYTPCDTVRALDRI